MNDDLDLIFQDNDKLLYSFDANWIYKGRLSYKEFIIGKCFVTKNYLILQIDVTTPFMTSDVIITSALFRIPTFLILPRNIITNIELKKKDIYIEGKRFIEDFSESKKISRRIAKKIYNPENIKLWISVKEKDKNKRQEILKELYDILNEGILR